MTAPDYWEKNGIEKPQSVIVCAANIVELNGAEVTLVGARHFDSVMKAQAKLMGVTNYGSHRSGFIDQFGDFYDRKEALAIVKASGQPFNAERNGSDDELFSEGLY
jgi:hypothetical protein